MKDWKTAYREKQMDIAQAINKVDKNHVVVLSAYCSEPQTLVEELIRQKSRLRGLELYVNLVGSPALYSQKDNFPYFCIRTFLSNPKLKEAILYGDCDYIPINVSEIPKKIERMEIDIAFIQVAPPDNEGFFNLGISVDYVKSLVENAKYVIAEVNDCMPRTQGDTNLTIDEIDSFVKSSRSLLTIPESGFSDIEKKIGENVATLIPDGATLQWGIGSIPNGILHSLKNKKDLGVHSGSISDPVIELIESGVINNSRKIVKQNKIVCTSLIGTEKLYEYANNNPVIEMHSVEFTHNSKIIGQIENFHSINSALEIDITGQINAESLKGVTIAGVGGQMDFIRGAKGSNGGKAIIALPSTAAGGTISRVKFSVSGVTSLKSEVDYIVTEYGIAELFGKSMKERGKEIIAIAHPKFREELAERLQHEITNNSDGGGVL